MSNEIRCPECGSQDVECVESPQHDHRCYACGHTLLGGSFDPTVDLAELDRLMRAARKDVWANTTTTHTRPALIAGLASQAEALRRALRDRELPDRMHLDAVIAERDALAVQFYEARAALVDAAAWVVESVGVPIDMTTSEPPPEALRQAMYRHCFEDPKGAIHGGDLTYDELVAFVDEEARWASIAEHGEGGQ